MSPNDRIDSGPVMAARRGNDTAMPPMLADSYGEASDALARRAVRASAGAPEAALSGNGFSYRHDWGLRRGQWTLRLNWAAVTPMSHVFVSIGEGTAAGPNAGKFVGSARYTVHNVAPRAGGVDIWVNVEWGADILLFADYVVVNPSVARTVRVEVHRHSSVALTDADADRILGDMGTALQTSDSPADTATRVQFVRNGPVRVLPAAVAGTIQTQAEWNTLMGAGTGVKVVQGIQWCGGPGGSIIGCAPVGNPNVNLAVVRFTANQEGILWAHEYGHNAGNPHRTNDTRALMFPSIGVDHNVVDGTESGRYLAGPLAVTGGLMATGCCHGEVPPVQDVREFVSQHWIEGVPYEAARQFTEEDAEELVAWLVNEPEKHEEFLPEIVTTLCFIGGDRAVAPLIDFVESPHASRAIFKAKHAALIHLGDLINRTGNRAAFNFLTGVAANMDTARSLAQPQASMAAAEKAQGVIPPTVETLGAELAVSATFGISLTGTSDAETVLDRLRSSAEAFTSVNQAASEAAEISATVRALGQKAYYGIKAEQRGRE